MKAIFPITLLSAGLVVAACSGDARSGRAASSAPHPVIRLAYQPFLASAPVFIALDQAFFEDEGLRVEPVEIAGARDSVAALVRGDIDAMTTFTTAGFFSAIDRGALMRLVADKGSPSRDTCVASGLLASPAMASRPVVPLSLKGTRVGYQEASISEYALDEFLRSGGLGRADYQFVYVSTQSARDALGRGTIDFRLTSEPELAVVEEGGQGKLWLAAANMVENSQWAAVAFGRRLLEDRDAGLRVMRAYLKGVERYNRGKEAASVSSVVRYTHLAPDVVQRACWEHVRGDGRLNLESLMSFQRWAKGRGYIDRVLEPAEFSDVWFVEHAADGSAAR